MYQNRCAINIYKKLNLHSLKEKVLNANPKELIEILFEILHSELKRAVFLIQNKKTPMKGESISYAISIIASGLIPALKKDDNFFLVRNLKSLYVYCICVLTEANLKNDTKKIRHVDFLLRKISSAWSSIK
ncbi:MAG: flagellar export chaperone FliS [Wigglesworthia glossinidia]|nr:flagellar export chaperone FliS [Wigglesworthia glossinidia]